MNEFNKPNEPQENRGQDNSVASITRGDKKKDRVNLFLGLFLGCAFTLLLLTFIGFLWIYKTSRPIEEVVKVNLKYAEKRLQEMETRFDAVLDERTLNLERQLTARLAENQKVLSGAINSHMKTIAENVSESLNDGAIRRSVEKVFADSLSRMENTIAHSLSEQEKSLSSLVTKMTEEHGNKASAQRAFAKAMELCSAGDIARAGLYFSNAVAKAPENWEYIDNYTKAILAWCEKTEESGNKEQALTVLADLESFLRAQVLNIDIQDLQNLEKALGKIASTRDRIFASREEDVTEVAQNEAKEAISKGRELMSRSIPKNQEALTYYLSELRETFANLQTGSAEKLNTETSELLASLDKRIAASELASEVIGLTQQAKDFLRRAKDEEDQPDIQVNYLSSAEAIVRQLTPLKAQLESPMATDIDSMVTELDRVTETVSRQRSEAIWDEISEAKRKIEGLYMIRKQIKCSKAIEQLTEFAKFCSQKIARIQHPEVVNKASALLDSTNQAISDWRTNQLQRYEAWSVGEARDLYESLKDELGAGTDEKKVYYQLQTRLGRVDTRYLSTPGARCYNEVFDLFYKELSDEQKIELTSKMALMEKKPLEAF